MIISPTIRARHRHFVFMGLVAAVAFAQDACSLALNTNDAQCHTDADCVALGPQFQGYVCNTAQNVCAPLEGFCSTNLDCINKNQGAPYICRKDLNQCESLLTTNCDKIIGDAAPWPNIANDNVLLLGASMVTAGSSNSRTGLSCSHCMELQAQEFATLGGTITPKGAPARPVVWVRCNEGVTSPGPENNVTHLVNDLQVPAMVGPGLSATGYPLTQQVIIPDNLLAVSPGMTTILADSLANRQNLWLLNASDKDIATIQALLVQQVWEPQIRAQNIVTTGAPIRVMLIEQADAFSLGTAPLIQAALQFNCTGPNGACLTIAAPTSQATWNGNFEVQDGGNYSDQTTYLTRIAAAVTEVNRFKPHVIVMASSAQGTDVLSAVEKGWTETTFKPRWSLPVTVNATDWVNFLGPTGGLPADLDSRMLGGRFGPSFTEPGAAALEQEYNTNFGSDQNTQYTATGALCYDAAWKTVLAIAATAAQGQPLTSNNISPNLMQLQGGTLEAAAEITNMANALSLLGGGAQIDYAGASGSTHFTNNDAEPTVAAYCIGPPSTPGNRIAPSGVGFDETKKALTGSVTCPFTASLPAGN